VPRRLSIALLAVALLAGGPTVPAASAERTLLMPGVTYERQIQFTAHGPVAIHVLTAPKPGGLWSLKPVLSNNAILGKEKVTDMQRNASRDATVAGVNGDLFAAADGRPTGVLMRSGVLDHPPTPNRSSIGITDTGSLRVERVRLFATWRGTGQRRPLDVNQAPGPNGVSLFTPAWGPTTPSLDNGLEVVLRPFPPTAPNKDLTGTVAAVEQGADGGTAIPPDGAVLAAQGAGTRSLFTEAPLGTTVTLRLLLSPDWNDVGNALGGGPVLVRDGKPVFRHLEDFTPAQLARNPRTGVGQLRDGRIVLVVVDGRRPGYSAGMTTFELAQTLVRLGAVSGAGLDSGGSSTMAFDGKLLNRPSDSGGERLVSEGLFVLYGGVYAAPPGEAVLSPNGDGVADTQSFLYKLPRPAHVTVALVGPRNLRRVVDDGDKVQGVYRFGWNAAAPGASPEPDGRWRLTVTAVDDLGRSSRADRLFAVNRTLGSLRVAPTVARVRRTGAAVTARFQLTRPARVTATVETASGVVVAVAATKTLRAGAQAIAWNGMTARRTPATSGRYFLRVAAANGVGRVDLAAAFTVRR
jgi:hypothetical protein